MKSKQGSCRAEQFKFVLAFASLAAVMCCGCVWSHIERSQPLTREVAATLVGEEAKLFLNDDIEPEVILLEVTEDSLLLATRSTQRYVHFDSVRAIVVRGSSWGKWGGALIGAAVGAGIGSISPKYSRAGVGTVDLSGLKAIVGGMLGSLLGALAGEFFITPDWRYVAPSRGIELQEHSLSVPATPKQMHNAWYILKVDRFLEESETYIIIPWQRGTAQLPKSEITIEKSGEVYRLTVPARLLRGESWHVNHKRWHASGRKNG